LPPILAYGTLFVSLGWWFGGTSMKPLTLAKVMVVLTLFSASVQAEVVYDFVGTGTALPPDQDPPSGLPAEQVAFQLTVPNFLNPPLTSPPTSAIFVDFTCAQLDSSTNCSSGINFSNQSVGGAFSAQLGFDTTYAAYAFFFPTGAFGTPGVYSSEFRPGTFDNAGTLTVTDTPEPATMVLVLGGICFCGLRRLLIKGSAASIE
jgi:hypothetical protein